MAASQSERPRLFTLGFSAIVIRTLPHHGPRRLLLTQPMGMGREEAEDTPLPFDGIAR